MERLKMNDGFGPLLKKGQPLIGTLVGLSDPQAAEVLAESGFDWLFVDGEHAPLGIREIQGILQAVSRPESEKKPVTFMGIEPTTFQP